MLYNCSFTCSPTASSPQAAEPSNVPHSYSHIPILIKDNYPKWQLSIKAYLTPGDHVHVIWCMKDAGGTLVDPVAPTDVAKLEKWTRSEGYIWGSSWGP